MLKNRNETEHAILQAVTDIVRERGFGSLGVNAVAETAGVSKVLIYRYFGSYKQLLEEWALGHNFWFMGLPEAERALKEASGNKKAIGRILKQMIRSQAEELRRDPLAREVLRWFLAEKDAAASSVMTRLEHRGVALMTALSRELDSREDVEAISAIIVSGVYYLGLLTDRAAVFNGVTISTDAGWERILSALERLIDSLL